MRSFAAIGQNGSVTTLVQPDNDGSWLMSQVYSEDTIQKTPHIRTEVWEEKVAQEFMASTTASDYYVTVCG